MLDSIKDRKYDHLNKLWTKVNVTARVEHTDHGTGSHTSCVSKSFLKPVSRLYKSLQEKVMHDRPTCGVTKRSG